MSHTPFPHISEFDSFFYSDTLTHFPPICHTPIPPICYTPISFLLYITGVSFLCTSFSSADLSEQARPNHGKAQTAAKAIHHGGLWAAYVLQ